MARQNKGQVTVNDLAIGTQFTLWFPRVDGELGARRQPVALHVPEPEARSGASILVVEDVDQVRSIAVRILRAAGFRTLTAEHGAEALALLDQDHEVSLILTDLQMPVMGGRELAARVRLRPDAPPVIFMTGYSEESHGAAADPQMKLLAKPFTPDRLIEFVKNALG
jgi:CheY-like chemotaxis protein